MTLDEFQAQTEGGRIFTVEFTKRTTGEVRVMNCRRGVSKNVTGAGRPYRVEDHNLLGVWDMKQPEGGNGHRVIPLDALVSLKFAGKVYRWEGTQFEVMHG